MRRRQNTTMRHRFQLGPTAELVAPVTLDRDLEGAVVGHPGRANLDRGTHDATADSATSQNAHQPATNLCLHVAGSGAFRGGIGVSTIGAVVFANS